MMLDVLRYWCYSFELVHFDLIMLDTIDHDYCWLEPELDKLALALGIL